MVTGIGAARGHALIYDNLKKNWVYEDTKKIFTNKPEDERSCKRCGSMPTAEGFDACLGHVSGAISACCGHGTISPFTKMA